MQIANKPGKPADEDFRVTRVAAPLRHSVVEAIRSAIAVGRYKAGERLVERDLCEMTGVSRTLLREALRQLESEGLITVLPNRGPVVAQLTTEEAQHIYQVRRELEGLAAELFVGHATPGHKLALADALDQLEATVATDDRKARLDAKNLFYGCLIEGSGNAALGKVLKLLHSQVMVLRATTMQQKDRWPASIAELRVLVQTIASGDAAAAREAARKHVSNAAQAALNLLPASAD